MTKILIEIDTDTQRVVPLALLDSFPEINPSNYDHDDACALNAWGVELILAAAPQPEPVDIDLRRDAELWRAHQKRKQDLIDRGFLRNPLRAAPQACLAEIVTIDASMLSQGEMSINEQANENAALRAEVESLTRQRDLAVYAATKARNQAQQCALVCSKHLDVYRALLNMIDVTDDALAAIKESEV